MTKLDCTNIKRRVQHDIKVGDIYTTNEGSTVTVLEYIDSRNITVVHNDEFRYTRNVSAGHLRDGKIKNPYFPSVSGVGYIGVGKHPSRSDGKITKAYHRWRNMLERCYSGKKELHPSYKDCVVDESWHNYQNFAEWYYNNSYFNESYHLDKDILSTECKTYSEHTCVLVPYEINHLFRDLSCQDRPTPRGLVIRDDGLISVFTHGDYIGVFRDIEKAKTSFGLAKYKAVMAISNKWKGLVDPRVDQALALMAESYLVTTSHN